MVENNENVPIMAEEESEPDNGKKKNHGFNIWAALFGVFYYIYKGLWKKGLLLSGLGMILLTIVHLIFPNLPFSSMSTAVSVGLFGSMANFDLFRKEEYGETMWVELPAIFNRNWFVAGLYVIILFVYMILPTTTLSEIEEASTEVVTEILYDYYELPYEAVNVKIVEEVAGEENLYIADATLSNDTQVQIFIEYFPDSHFIEVFIPEEEILFLLGDLNL